MNEPDISPLAKRLAEENNVRWQELKGSGAGGKVVERDVLEYLARVMAGEEAIDPTPEPLPDGMEAWPEEDVSAWKRDNGALDDLQAELSAAERVDDDLMLDPEATADDDEELISEDIFLFEDGESEVEAVGNTIEDDGLLISGDDDVIAPVATSEPETLPVAEAAVDDIEAPEIVQVDDAAELDDDLPDLFAVGDDGDEEDDALFAEVEDPLGVLVDDGTDEAFAEVEMDGAAASDAVEEVAIEAVEETPGDAALVLDDLDAEALDRGDGELELPDSELDLAYDAVDEPEHAPLDPEHAALDTEEELSLDDEDPTVEAAADDDGGDAETDDDADAVGGADLDAAVTAPVVTEALVDLPLVSHGALLRRHIDLTALAAAQLAVGRELGLDDPVAPKPFLVRAAAKALVRVELGNGTLGVASFDGGVSVNGLVDAATMPFTELIDAVAEANGAGDDVALVVADMSELEIDEAVLHLDAPVLILGRVLYDNQQGSYRSTLSLSGAIAPDRGGRLLARVAELLDAPVQLVM